MRFHRLLVQALALAVAWQADAERISSTIKTTPGSASVAVKTQKKVSNSKGGDLLGFVLKIAAPVTIGAAALAYLGMKLRKSAGDVGSIPKHKFEEVGPDRPLTESFEKLLDGNVVAVDDSGNTTTEFAASSVTGSHVCVIFDCNKDVGKKDEKARLDFFQLLSNLTSPGKIAEGASMKTVYVQGRGNKHLLETFAPSHWNYVANSKDGRAVAKALRLKYNVKDEEFRILVIGPDGQVTSENALDLLRVNANEMPWSQRSLKELLGTSFLGGSGGADLQEFDLSGKTVGLYFSAAWCQPCQQFTPKLVETYEKLLKARAADIAASVETKAVVSSEAEAEAVVDASAASTTEEVATSSAEEEVVTTVTDKSDLEVVFISLDAEVKAFDEYRAKMPWPAVPFQDMRRALLQIGLGVKSLPTLVLFDSEGKLITRSGVTELLNDEESVKFPWGYDIIDLSQGVHIEKLQRNPALIALTDNCDAETRAAVRAAVKEVAISSKSPLQVPNNGRGELLYCVLDEEGKLAEALRELAGLPEGVAGPQFALLDLPREECGAIPTTSVDVSSNNYKEIVSQISQLYKSYSIQMVDLKLADETAAGAGAGAEPQQ